MPSRKFKSEGPILYQRYQFGYCEWAEWEETDPAGRDDLGEIYASGYLPYSASVEDPRHLFYMARSLRVALDRFAMDKKRRYDHREWTGFGLHREALAKATFLERHGEESAGLARTWMQARFGDAFLSPERYAYILAKPFLQDVLAWYHQDRLTAFALVVRGAWGAHYWYVFYANGAQAEHPPGHGYLIDFLDWSRSAGIPFAYLGTCYGTKSRYKARGIDGIEFWDGNDWSHDREALDQLRVADDGPQSA